MSKTPRPLILAAALIAAVATAAAAQTTGGTPPKTDCAKVKAAMDHPGSAPMDHAAMMKQMTECGIKMSDMKMDDMKMDDMKMSGMKMGDTKMGEGAMAMPTMSGQAAFGTIGEIVRILENDPATDWSKVNIEALRKHLIDMDDVTMHSRVAQHNVPGGFTADVTGAGATAAAIRRMVPSHAKMFEGSPEFNAQLQLIPGGVRLTLLARTPADTALVARVRGLGVIGFLTEGDHHARHHLAIARGDAMAHMH